ncbi:MAG: Crp/Fnr family transcriptional regulator [Synechococcus sp.]
MDFRFLPDEPSGSIRIPTGQTVLINTSDHAECLKLNVLEGIARVYCPCEETEGMTLAFLQDGDQLRTDCLCSEGVCVEALTTLQLETKSEQVTGYGYDCVNEWTLQLLRIRHLGQAEQRLHALLSLLVHRLGKRYGDWCSLPFRLTHERIGELIGSTRVTSTRLMSKLRHGDMLKIAPGESEIRLSPDLINTSPLTF